jgi:Zn-dependent protease
MMPTRQGSVRLFQFAGITVYLHWLWFAVAFYGITTRVKGYTSVLWPALEYLALFALVLTHEFGHALACRSVGGKAEQIVLWPLGGVAYVSPPPRPGPVLWSIAAGPLVNVVLAPLFLVLWVLGNHAGWAEVAPNAFSLLQAVCFMNLGLLAFNLLPVYPLDGGQILQALLWFVLGRARSLMVTTAIGFVGVAGLLALAWWAQSWWMAIVAVFILMNCWRGLAQARLLAKIAKLPRRSGFACPACNQPPASGPYWRCAKCLKGFDTFESNSTCPHCGTEYPVTQCLDCGSAHPMAQWVLSPAFPTEVHSPPAVSSPSRRDG